MPERDPHLSVTTKKRKYRHKSTSTSAFGTSGRIGHDSSKFYASKLYDGIRLIDQDDAVENPVDPTHLDRIFLASSERMETLPDRSVHLMITSPPYNVTKEYDNDLTMEEYRALLRRVFTETFRVLVDGGRACINVANLGRKPYIPLHAHIIQDMLEIGYQMRGEIIWDKGASASPSTAWGSWRSAANPTLRDVHEYVLIFTKGNFGRQRGERKDTIGRDEFLAFTKSVWTFPAARARSIGHPAPFPVELPRRLTELFTFSGDIVLDPFCGSGSTCIAAALSGRHYIGYDVKKQYVALAEHRIKAALDVAANPNGNEARRKKKR